MPETKARGLSKNALFMKEKRKVIIDPLSMMWNTIAFVLFLWAATYVDTHLVFAVKALLAFCIGICGFFMAIITSPGARWDKKLDVGEINAFFYLIGLASFAVLVINAVTFKFLKLEATPMPFSLFTVLVGVQEENLCRAWLQGLFANLFENEGVAILFSNSIFTAFHGAVYGLEIQALAVVFGAGCFLGLVFMLSRRLSITQTAHGLINFLSALALRLK